MKSFALRLYHGKIAEPGREIRKKMTNVTPQQLRPAASRKQKKPMGARITTREKPASNTSPLSGEYEHRQRRLHPVEGPSSLNYARGTGRPIQWKVTNAKMEDRWRIKKRLRSPFASPRTITLLFLF